MLHKYMPDNYCIKINQLITNLILLLNYILCNHYNKNIKYFLIKNSLLINKH